MTVTTITVVLPRLPQTRAHNNHDLGLCQTQTALKVLAVDIWKNEQKLLIQKKKRVALNFLYRGKKMGRLKHKVQHVKLYVWKLMAGPALQNSF